MDAVPNRTTGETRVAGYSQSILPATNTHGAPRISVIVPNYNGAATIGRCLGALLALGHDCLEIIIVDDCSTDNSAAIINQYSCRLIQLKRHIGAAAARNIGAAHSRADILFFTDADCLVRPETLLLAEAAVNQHGAQTIIGGSYTPLAADDKFFSTFQAIFIHYSELKNASAPDYIATHAMALTAAAFRKSGGFNEDFMPILEDVEFSHRARRRGYTLLMTPGLLVRHIFNYSLLKSLANAYRKSRFWTIYSLANKDIFCDSGTASRQLKLSVTLFYLQLLLLFLWKVAPAVINPLALLIPIALNLIISRRFIRLCRHTAGLRFALAAGLYYMLVYPLAVGAGTMAGILNRRQICLPTEEDVNLCEIPDRAWP